LPAPQLIEIAEPTADGTPRFDLDVIYGDVVQPTMPNNNTLWPTLFIVVAGAVMQMLLIGHSWSSSRSLVRESDASDATVTTGTAVIN
jgi:hypothetical protein